MFTRLSLIERHCKIIEIDLSKQQALNVDLKAKRQINFTGNLDQEGNTKMFFITEKAK